MKLERDGYAWVFVSECEASAGFYYNSPEEAFDHWEYKSGYSPSPTDRKRIESRLVVKNGRYVLKETARLGIVWWTRNDNNKKI